MAMGAELADCACSHVLDYIIRMDGYAGQMARFRGDAAQPKEKRQ